VVARTVARRSLLKAGAAAGGGWVLAGLGGVPAVATPGAGTHEGRAAGAGISALAFQPVAPNRRDNVTVAEGFRHDVLVGWGDPVELGAPRFDVHRQTPEAQMKQFGYNCDYVGVLPLPGRERALLVVNHEYTDEVLMHPSGSNDEDTIKRIAMAAHGISVVEIDGGARSGSWRRTPVRRTRHNRRITVHTKFELTGPAAGAARLRTSADPGGRTVRGTVNNCAGGTTPWGTTLHGEENFNGYFDATGGLAPRYADSYARYGITGTGRGWHTVDPRFDLTAEPHEPFRFGWVVELDPYDPRSVPRKRTMLGRFKHEGANASLSADGRAVVYMGDDERGDYIYKFVSRDVVAPGAGWAARRHNLTVLDHGTLFVARFRGDGLEDGEYDGAGEWIALCTDTESYVDDMTVSDVLIDTRLAADRMSPTRMDRPEDIERNPVTGRVYCALTNNSQRGTAHRVDEANPIASSMVREAPSAPLQPASGNRNGYVLELTEGGNDGAATAFTWNLLLVCGDPEAAETYFGGYPKDQVSPISCPDNVTFDAAGNLWISTDGNALGANDGLFAVPTTGPERGRVRQFLSVPIGAETCGPLIVDDTSVFVAVQHPGEVDGATFENPASTWPHPGTYPRPSVVVAFRGGNAVR
ncbi:MAG TPA: PhoX family phosphatase, partial [Nocardioidaceae bacterium]|nr:PhoX family phosphatase [Nocardioidaceae bacterium]